MPFNLRPGTLSTILRGLLYLLRRSRHDADLREEIALSDRPRWSVTASVLTTRRGQANGPSGT